MQYSHTAVLGGITARVEQFREWVIEQLLPAVRRGEVIGTEGTPMQDVQDMTDDELFAKVKAAREDCDYWRALAESL